MYRLENNVAWTTDLKNAFKRNVTRAKILYDNIEINEGNYIQDLTIEEQRYIKNYGFVGTATAKKLELNVLDINGELNLENKEVVVKIGADYDGDTYYINYGNFIVDSAPQHDETNGKTRVVAYDYMIKFNKPYVDRVVYPCTLLTLLQDVCSQAGVTLGNTNFANATFSVENNQFEGYTLRQVLQNIAKCAFSWARIGQDNKLYLDFSLTPEITEPITINEYKLNSFKKAIEYYGPVNQVTYADSDIEGQEEKVPSAPPVGDLKELVIYDNLFAYTAEKRHELIQAGTMLLGLEYMPISQLELIGFAYLDCKDAIEVDTLDEETFSSRVFIHRIKYNGTLHDNIITEGTSGNEQVYKNTATDMFQNQQTQIKVDRANKNIKLLTEEVDDQNSKISQLEIDMEGIEAQVASIYSTTKRVAGTKSIILTECVKGYLIELRIRGNNTVFDRLYPADDLYPLDTLYPRGDSRVVVTDENGNSTVYELRIPSVLRANDEVYDEYILKDNFAKVIRRVNPDGTTKEVETEEIIGTYTIYIEDGQNTVTIQNYSAPIEALYVEQNAYTDQFATVIEMNSSIELAEQEINIELSKKVDDEELTGANIMLRINDDESEAMIKADKISLEGKTIDLTGEDITIDSDNFKVDAEGNVVCNSLELTGGSIDLDIDDGSGVEYFKLKSPLHESEVVFTGRNVEMWSKYSNFRMIDIGVFSNEAKGYIDCVGRIEATEMVCDTLQVYGTKNRIVEIDNGEKVLLNAYETATPYFGDIGSNKTNENGICRIDIEEIFSQTIELENYKVFIQKCGEGDLYVKKYDKYFEVIGTPNLEFDWELKAVQKGFLNTRLEKYKGGEINGKNRFC